MVVALIALFVALGGSGYAAIRHQERLPAGQEAQAQLGHREAGQGVHARDRAARPERDPAGWPERRRLPAEERHGRQLAEAGRPARTSFVRRECDVDTGQIKGVVTVTASPTFPSAFTTVPGYNCSGQPIDVRRLSMGRYEVRFNGNPTTAGVMTPRETGALTHESGVFPETAGSFQVNTATGGPAPAFADVSFTFVVL